MSSKHRSNSKHDTKAIKLSRNIIAFFMFIIIFILSACICGKTVVLNTNKMAECLTDKAYNDALYADVKQFSDDLCSKYSLPKDIVDNSLTKTAVSDINKAYVYGNLCTVEEYNATTYQDKINELSVEIGKTVKQNIKAYRLSLGDSYSAEAVDVFAVKITDYLKKTVEIEYASKLQTTANIGSAGLVGGMIFSAIMLIVLMLAQISIGSKKYRSLRAVSYSFIAGGILNFVMVLGVEIVKLTKSLVIYPTYLCDAAMSFVQKSEATVALAGLACWALATVVIAIGWRLKRDEK